MALFLFLIAIIMLNLLIAIINESYQRIRDGQAAELIRNKVCIARRACRACKARKAGCPAHRKA
jgi:hypothetical protein